jgi:hypothetical protein
MSKKRLIAPIAVAALAFSLLTPVSVATASSDAVVPIDWGDLRRSTSARHLDSFHVS